jgi:hypothetical protein
MESEMCVYLEWKLNVGGEEVLEFEAKIRVQFGLRLNSSRKTPFNGTSSHSSDSYGASAIVTPASSVYPTPDLTPSIAESRAIRHVLSPAEHPSYHISQRQPPHHHIAPAAPSIPPSPPAFTCFIHVQSPQPPPYISATSSLQSSPASEDCKTPFSIASPAPHRHFLSEALKSNDQMESPWLA